MDSLPKTEIDSNKNTIHKITGVAFILVAFLMVVLIKCPSNAQLFMLYTLTGIGIAFLFLKSAEKTTAKFKIKNIAVFLSGAVALPFILFFTNPIGEFMTNDCVPLVNTSVFVHGKNGKQDMILRKQGHVIMDVRGGERKVADINENGIAYFQNLKVGEKITLDVDFSEPYKSIKPDSVYVIDNSGNIYMQVALQGINQVKGRVLYHDVPLSGVTVSIGMLEDITDESGRYQINIPEKEQKQQYEVWFNKAEFKIKAAPAFPQTGADLNVIMEK